MPDNDAITKPNPGRGSGTSVSWKEYVDIRLAANEQAVELAREILMQRLETMNQIREQLRDQAQTFIPRSEFTIMCKKTDDDIRSLRESRAELAGKASQKDVDRSTAIAIFGLILGIVGLAISFLH